MNKIFAVVGMCGSGKTEVVNYFVKNSYKRVYFGEVVIDELKYRGLGINETNEKMIRESLRLEYGMGAMALKSLPKIQEYYSNGNVVIESLYSWEEFKIIKNIFGEVFRLLAVYTTKELRYERLKNRKFRPLNFEEASARDISEIENLDKGGPIAYADYLIVNDLSLTELYDNLKILL